MSTTLTPGTRVQVKPRTGTIQRVEFTATKRDLQPNGRYKYTDVPVYVVALDDGMIERLNGFEIEAIDS